MQWPDLRAHGVDLVVEQTAGGQRLALRSTDGRPVPVAVGRLGFAPDGQGGWIRENLQLRLSALRSVFPGAGVVDATPNLVDGDRLRRLREAMRRSYGADVDVERFIEATPGAATAVRARAMAQLLGIQPQFLRYTGTDARLQFAGVALRDRGDTTVYVNVESPFAATAVLGHEALHVMRRQHPGLYADLVAGLRPLIDQPAFARYAARLNAGNVDTDGRIMAFDELREEAVADIVGDMLLDQRVWAALDDRSLVERLLQWLAQMLQDLIDRWHQRRPALDGTLGSRELLRDLEAARQVVTDTLIAWRDANAPVEQAAGGVVAAFRTVDGPRPPVDLLPHSAIREPDGTIKVVFRGEHGPLVDDPFDATRLNTPSFTASPDVACVYATGSGQFSRHARVRACVLDIRNPLQLGNLQEDVVDFGMLRDALVATGKVTDTEVRWAWARSEGYLRHWSVSELAKSPEQRDDPQEYCLGWPHTLEDISDEDYTESYRIADSLGFVQLAHQAGFDGFVYQGVFTSPDQFDRPMEQVIAAGYDNDLSMAMEYRPFHREQVLHVHSDAVPTALRSADFRKLFHGSPHRFERPDLSHVLSGEGFNAQGHGFYMAENESVAEGYRKAIAYRNRAYRIGDGLHRRLELPAALGMSWTQEQRDGVELVCDLMAEGRSLPDVVRVCESRTEPERSILLDLCTKIESVGVGDLENQSVYLSHRGGVEMVSRGPRAPGYTRVRFDMAYFMSEGLDIDQARQRVLEEQRQRAGALRAQLSQDLADQSRIDGQDDEDARDRVRRRVFDTRWFLGEAEAAVQILEDPDTLAFDVRGWRHAGHFYEADLSEQALLLDWDADLRQQPPALLDALTGAGLVSDRAQTEGPFTGKDLYQTLERDLGSAELVSDALMRAGIAGVRYLDGGSRPTGQGTYNYVVWDLEQLEDFQMRFAGRPGPQTPGAEPHYSALVTSIQAGRGAPRNATAATWIQWLDGAQRRGEFRQAERDWMGLDGWLAEQPGTISRTALADYVSANQVVVTQQILNQTLTAENLPEGWRLRYNTDLRPSLWELLDERDELRGIGSTQAIALEDVRDEFLQDHGGGMVRHAAYQLPGGQNYQEMLIQVPPREVSLAQMQDKMVNQHGWTLPLTDDQENQVLIAWRQYTMRIADFTTPHFPGYANIVSHVRFNERTDADGARVLFIEEVQSDWHQEGRRKGYAVPVVVQQEGEAFNLLSPEGDRLGGPYPDRRLAEAIARKLGPQGVPDAPFKATEDWAMLAIRSVIRHAVENGFDRIGWTTGEQQVERYKLSTVIDRIEYKRLGDGELLVEAFKADSNNPVAHTRGDHQAVADMLGKELADRVQARATDHMQELTGVDLEIGGKGMRTFYDQILPRAVGHWAKRFDAQVHPIRIPMVVGDEQREIMNRLGQMFGLDREDDPHKTVHSLDITDSMRQAVLDGMPLFRRMDEPRQDATSAPVFHSALLAALEAGHGAPNSAGADGWRQWLDGAQRRGLFRQAERDWLQVDDWLQRQAAIGGTSALVDLVTEGATLSPAERRRIADDPGLVSKKITRQQMADFVRHHQVHLVEEVLADGQTRHDGHVLPGGEMYRELLLTLPAPVPEVPENAFIAQGYVPDSEGGRLFCLARRSDGQVFHAPDLVEAGSLSFADLPEPVRQQALQCVHDEASHFIGPSGHFDTPDILAHVRFNERADEQGRRLVFIEEIQSDWHQEGRKYGYRQADGSLTAGADPVNNVPDAPFKRSEEWSMLVVKRMVRWAAEHGFDGVGWTTGAQQSERYRLERHIAEATVTRKDDGWVVEAMNTAGRWVVRQQVASVEELARLLGKDLSEQSRGMKVGQVKDYAGLDMRVGAAGMTSFYDVIVPKAVNRWAKAYGSQVEQTVVCTEDRYNPQSNRLEVVLDEVDMADYPVLYDDAQNEITPDQAAAALAAGERVWGGSARPISDVHCLLLTPDMRDAALEGLPLFRRHRNDNVLYLRDAAGNLMVSPKRPDPPAPPPIDEPQAHEDDPDPRFAIGNRF